MLPLETERIYFLRTIPDGGVDNGPVDERSIVQRFSIRANLGLTRRGQLTPISFTDIASDLRAESPNERNLKVSFTGASYLDMLYDIAGAFIDMKVSEPISFCLIDQMRFCLIGASGSLLLEDRFRKLAERGMIDQDSAQNGQHRGYIPGREEILLRTVWFQEPVEGEPEYKVNYEVLNNDGDAKIWAKDTKIGDLDSRILLEAYTLHIFDRQIMASRKQLREKTENMIEEGFLDAEQQIPFNLNP